MKTVREGTYVSDLPKIMTHETSGGQVIQVLNNDMIDLRQSIDTKNYDSSSFMTPGCGHMKTKSAINFGIGSNFTQQVPMKSQMTAASTLFT